MKQVPWVALVGLAFACGANGSETTDGGPSSSSGDQSRSSAPADGGSGDDAPTLGDDGGPATLTPEGGTGTPPVLVPDASSKRFAVTTNRYDNVRNGANTFETTLNVANVGGGKFGLQFSRPVDGQVYAQPLYLPDLVIKGAAHDVLFVATEHDTVYAYDAGDPAATMPFWVKSLGTPVDLKPGSNVSCGDMFPKEGVTSTPVIDRTTGRMYVVARTVENGTYFHRLHVLDVSTGNDIAGSPVTIQGSSFSPMHHMNRPGLLLTGGNVYIAFSSHCDNQPNHGWLFSYDANTLAQTGILNTTPNGSQGGIWQSGIGVVGDQNGDVFIAVGNGDIDTSNKGAQLGLSVARLSLTSTGLKTMDWWTPFNAGSLNGGDLDLTGAAILLPDPKVIVAGSKDGNIYVIDPANMGKYSNTANNIIQTFAAGAAHIHGGPVYWKGPSGPSIYVWPEGGFLRSFGFNGRQINGNAISANATDRATHPGGIVSLSSNGEQVGTGIVWATFTNGAIDPSNGGDAWHHLVPGAFYAFDATNLTHPIWTSLANKARDDLGIFAKFNPPIVANGRVYLASHGVNAGSDAGRIQVYGLLP